MDNSAASTIPENITEEALSQYWNDGENPYACAATTDTVFLLSEREATTREYGFDDYDKWVGDGTTTTSTRIRVTTDYAKATGAYQDSSAGDSGWWWLRSPNCDLEDYALGINYDGSADYTFVDCTNGGVVPALCVQLE